MRYDHLDMLPELAFKPVGKRMTLEGGKSKAPPAPDYTGAAAATAAGNLEAAKATAAANRVNQVTPYGNLTYSRTPTIDQGAYDKAMANYQSQLSNYNQSLQDYNSRSNNQSYSPFGIASYIGNQSRGVAPVAPIAPTADKYQTGESWTATQTLSPDQQAILNANNQLDLGLMNTANTGLNYANKVLSQPGVDTRKLTQMQGRVGNQATRMQSQVSGQGVPSLQSTVNNPNLQTSLNTSGLPSIKSNIDTNGLPSMTSNVPGGQYATNYNVQSATGNVANPMLQTSTGANQLAGGNVTNPNVQTSLNLAGVPSLKSNIDQYGQIQNQINTSGLPSYGINPGESYSDAIMRRLQPDLERQRSSEEARLANQGIGLGSNAYSTAKDILGRQQNDAMTSAIVQGMGVGLQANQQQFGQNAAQQQAINAAQAQGFGQNAAQTQAQNVANAQAYQQALASGQFGNQAAGQQFGQNLSAQQLQNQAAAQNNALAQSNAQFANQAANTQFGQNLNAAQLANQAAAQNTGNAANLAAFQNQGVGQQFQQGLANAQLANQANQQQFGQNAAQQQAQNAAQAQGYNQALSSGQFGNQAAGQQFQQNLSAADLANQANQQQFGQNATQAQLANQINQQQYNQQLQNAQLANQVNQQGFQQESYNQMQPINVINALRTGSQVTNPSYASVPQQANTAGADILGATQAGYNAQLGAVNAKNAASGNFMGGLMGLGGAAMMSPAGTFKGW